MGHTTEDDLAFIMTCLKHTPGLPKPDFSAVAKEAGAKSKDSCYFRHYTTLKKWGIGGISGRAKKTGTTNTSVSGKKRGRTATKTTANPQRGDQVEDGEKSPSEYKKVKQTALKEASDNFKSEEDGEAADEVG